MSVQPDLFLNGERLTADEIKKRFHIALSMNNDDIMRALYEAKQPLTLKEILGENFSVSTRSDACKRIKRMRAESLIFQFGEAKKRFYVLTVKGANAYELTLERKGRIAQRSQNSSYDNTLTNKTKGTQTP